MEERATITETECFIGFNLKSHCRKSPKTRFVFLMNSTISAFLSPLEKNGLKKVEIVQIIRKRHPWFRELPVF
jgi:hypothetical protein